MTQENVKLESKLDRGLARSLVLNYLKKNSKLPSIFRALRKEKTLTLFGDYPLISFSVRVARKYKTLFDRNQIRKTLKLCKDFNDLPAIAKSLLVDQLFLGEI